MFKSYEKMFLWASQFSFQGKGCLFNRINISQNNQKSFYFNLYLRKLFLKNFRNYLASKCIFYETKPKTENRNQFK
jgi:hypothetical protein